MSTIHKADPAARRNVGLLIVAGVLLGAALITGFDRYGGTILDWILADPEQVGHRLRQFFLLMALVGSAPLLLFTLWLWSLGSRVMHARRFPLPDQRVLRDTPVLEGEEAVSRGRGLKVLAVSMALAGVVLWFLLWRVAVTLAETIGA